jgi:Tfp pilus assembly protein PilX
MTTGVAAGALPFTGFSLAWIVFLSIFLAIIVVAMVRIARIPTRRAGNE